MARLRVKLLLAALAALSFSLPLSGQIVLGNPAIPEHESLSYRKTLGGKTSMLRVDFDFVKDKAGSWYEVRTRAPDQDALFRLDSRNLFCVSSEVTAKGGDATLRRSTTVLENRARPGDGELLVGGYESLVYELRGYPWGRVPKARLVFLGAGEGGGNFRFELSVLGREDMEAAGRSIPCWKAQLGLTGVFGAFVGKTMLWYSEEEPHYLVRSEGASGPPGSPTAVLILESYAAAPGKR